MNRGMVATAPRQDSVALDGPACERGAVSEAEQAVKRRPAVTSPKPRPSKGGAKGCSGIVMQIRSWVRCLSVGPVQASDERMCPASSQRRQSRSAPHGWPGFHGHSGTAGQAPATPDDRPESHRSGGSPRARILEKQLGWSAHATAQRVPGRSFPFGSHLDRLGGAQRRSPSGLVQVGALGCCVDTLAMSPQRSERGRRSGRVLASSAPHVSRETQEAPNAALRSPLYANAGFTPPQDVPARCIESKGNPGRHTKRGTAAPRRSR